MVVFISAKFKNSKSNSINGIRDGLSGKSWAGGAVLFLFI